MPRLHNQDPLSKDPLTAQAPAAAAASKPKSLLDRLIREWLIPLGIVAAVMIPIRSVIADWNDVPSGSMRPTILEGDRIFVNKLAFGLRFPLTQIWIARWDEPRRGDIITFASPADGIRLVKRVVGVPGDHLELRRNVLYINGVAGELLVTDNSATAPMPNGARIPVVIARENLLGVDHAITMTPGLVSLSSFPEVVVPQGKFFVMGDNRDQSNDSRFIGMVPMDSVYGRCGGIALSLNPEHGYAPRWERWFSGLK